MNLAAANYIWQASSSQHKHTEGLRFCPTKFKFITNKKGSLDCRYSSGLGLYIFKDFFVVLVTDWVYLLLTNMQVKQKRETWGDKRERQATQRDTNKRGASACTGGWEGGRAGGHICSCCWHTRTHVHSRLLYHASFVYLDCWYEVFRPRSWRVSNNRIIALSPNASDEDRWSDDFQPLMIFSTRPSNIAFWCHLMIRFSLRHQHLTIHILSSYVGWWNTAARVVLKTVHTLAASDECIIIWQDH